jgi:hypothetical protein
MKFSIGDNIILKRTGEEGHVSAYIDKQMIEVEVGGTAFPVYIEDIDHPYLKWFTEKNAVKKKQSPPEQLPVEKITARAPRLAKGVYLSFLPVLKTAEMEEVVTDVKIYLLNELPVAIKYVYDVRIADNSLFRHEGTLHAFGNVYLHSMEYAVMNDQPRFNWTLTDIANEAHKTEQGILRIRPAKLFEHVNKIMQGGEPSFSYVLTDTFSVKAKPEPASKIEPVIRHAKVQAVTSRNIEAARYEVDLHIENLVSDVKGLSNAEMMIIQLETLQRYVQLAIVHRQERMVVIHGLGKGKLRDEVHALLKTTKYVARYKNEWSGKYGFGATEITFKY